MIDAIQGALPDLISATPFGVMCAIFLWVFYLTHNKDIKALTKLHKETVEQLREVYRDAYGKLDERKHSKRK